MRIFKSLLVLGMGVLTLVKAQGHRSESKTETTLATGETHHLSKSSPDYLRVQTTHGKLVPTNSLGLKHAPTIRRSYPPRSPAKENMIDSATDFKKIKELTSRTPQDKAKVLEPNPIQDIGPTPAQGDTSPPPTPNNITHPPIPLPNGPAHFPPTIPKNMTHSPVSVPNGLSITPKLLPNGPAHTPVGFPLGPLPPRDVKTSPTHPPIPLPNGPAHFPPAISKNVTNSPVPVPNGALITPKVLPNGPAHTPIAFPFGPANLHPPKALPNGPAAHNHTNPPRHPPVPFPLGPAPSAAYNTPLPPWSIPPRTLDSAHPIFCAGPDLSSVALTCTSNYGLTHFSTDITGYWCNGNCRCEGKGEIVCDFGKAADCDDVEVVEGACESGPMAREGGKGGWKCGCGM